MYAKTVTAALVASLFASANAHFFIKAPAPIPGTAPKDPLDASGSNFPCHGADLSAGTSTSMAVGSDQPLQFELGGGANTAVHGGGSCQISVTYEKDATKLKDPASWKVIQSFVGGCPTNAHGNLPTAVECPQAAPDCIPKFSFKIPAEVENGDAIMAWTWFNNVGNREMYMNCAKVSFTGGQNKLSSLPNMFVANLASINQCKTTEQYNTDFPDPGSYVTKDATLNYPLKAPAGTGCGSGSGSADVPAAAPAAGSSAAGSSAAAASPVASATSSANDGQYTGVGATPTSASGASGGVFAPGASSAAASSAAASPTATQVATTFVTSTAPVAAPTGAASPAAAPAPAGSSTGACTNGQVSCSASGFYCIDAATFGMCAYGCATPMKMSDGTSCTNGAVGHAVSQPKQRRTVRNVHRRHMAVSF